MGVPAGLLNKRCFNTPKPYGRLLVRHTTVDIVGLSIVHDKACGRRKKDFNAQPCLHIRMFLPRMPGLVDASTDESEKLFTLGVRMRSSKRSDSTLVG